MSSSESVNPVNPLRRSARIARINERVAEQSSVNYVLVERRGFGLHILFKEAIQHDDVYKLWNLVKSNRQFFLDNTFNLIDYLFCMAPQSVLCFRVIVKAFTQETFRTFVNEYHCSLESFLMINTKRGMFVRGVEMQRIVLRAHPEHFLADYEGDNDDTSTSDSEDLRYEYLPPSLCTIFKMSVVDNIFLKVLFDTLSPFISERFRVEHDLTHIVYPHTFRVRVLFPATGTEIMVYLDCNSFENSLTMHLIIKGFITESSRNVHGEHVIFNILTSIFDYRVRHLGRKDLKKYFLNHAWKDRTKVRIIRGAHTSFANVQLFRYKAILFANHLLESFFEPSFMPNEFDTRYLEIYYWCETMEEKVRAHKLCFYDFLKYLLPKYQEQIRFEFRKNKNMRKERRMLHFVITLKQVLAYVESRLEVLTGGRRASIKTKVVKIREMNEEKAGTIIHAIMGRCFLAPSRNYLLEPNPDALPDMGGAGGS